MMAFVEILSFRLVDFKRRVFDVPSRNIFRPVIAEQMRSQQELVGASLDPKEIKQKLSPSQDMALYIRIGQKRRN